MPLRLRNPFPALSRAPFYRKLWFAGGAVGLFLLTVAVGNNFIPRERALTSRMLGHDFLVFYTAGRFAREGRTPELYDLWTIAKAEFRTGQACGLEMGPGFGPWWNPPVAAWVWAPLSVMTYPDALDAWRTFSFVALIFSVMMMNRMLPRECGLGIRLLLPLLLCVSMPFMQAVSHGQNTFLSLILLTSTIALWRSEKALLAGIACGLLFYKPQLGAIVALVLIANLGRRALLGVSITGAFLSLVTVITMPGALLAYAMKLGPNLRWMQEENHYLWQRHITLKAFWRLLFQGTEFGASSWLTIAFWTITTIALGGALARVAWIFWRDGRGRDPIARDRLIGATIVSMPLLMPFYFDYDLVLISIAAVLFAAEMLKRRALGEATSKQDTWLVRAWCALYGWTLLNTSLAGHLRLNLTAMLLMWVSALTIQRAMRTIQSNESAESPDVGAPALSLRPLGRAA